MARSTAVPANATVTVPPWLSGGDPAQFLREAELHAVNLPESNGSYRVRPVERYERRLASLVVLDSLTTPERIRARLEQPGPTKGHHAIFGTRRACPRRRQARGLTVVAGLRLVGVAYDVTELQIMTGQCWTHMVLPLRRPAEEVALERVSD